MSFLTLSDGTKPTENTFDMGGGNLEPIPEGTTCKAMITNAEWGEYEGDRYINIRWDVIAPEEYKNRVIFQKLRVYESDPAKADKAKRMLIAIDNNAKGKVQQIAGEPTDQELMLALGNCSMLIKLGVWEINDKSGNWVKVVAATNDTQPATQPAQAAPIDENKIPF